MSEQIGSTPNFSQFDPREVPYQARVVDDMHYRFDWSLGMHEILLSGSVGSAKSILAAHEAIKHCLMFPRARGCICRKAMPDLRDTIYAKLVEHLEGTILEDGTQLIEGKHYFLKDTMCQIRFWNGSQIIARSWSDKRYKKMGSLELSFAIVEELTENDDSDEMAIKYLRTRVGRLPHIRQSWIMYLTNPDSPQHFAYDYFDIGKRFVGITDNLPANRHVYFSKTSDNKFLPATYISQLQKNIDPKLALRLIEGLWTEITKEVVYYSYGEHNYKDQAHELLEYVPVALTFDFNIAQGKPMSMCIGQYDPTADKFHVFAEAVVEGADTEAILEEIAGRGHLNYEADYIVYGDATGAARSTQSKKSNYDIIRSFLANYRTPSGSRVHFTEEVPLANPPIRERHKVVNGYCKNALGETRLTVYQGAPTVHKGMRLTALKKGGQYVEDDTKEYQHVTTALGYWMHRVWIERQSNTGIRTKKIR